MFISHFRFVLVLFVCLFALHCIALGMEIIGRQSGNTRISYVICLVLVNKDTP